MADKKKTPRTVYVEWLDSASSYGWRHEDTIEDQAPVSIRTIGYLVHETSSHVTISSSYSDTGNYDSPISIPKKAITKRVNDPSTA